MQPEDIEKVIEKATLPAVNAPEDAQELIKRNAVRRRLLDLGGELLNQRAQLVQLRAKGEEIRDRIRRVEAGEEDLAPYHLNHLKGRVMEADARIWLSLTTIKHIQGEFNSYLKIFAAEARAAVKAPEPVAVQQIQTSWLNRLKRAYLAMANPEK